MTMDVLRRSFMRAACASLLATALGSAAAYAQSGSIKIGFLIPLTGPLATPGKDMDDGFKLYWEQASNQAGGRKVEVIVADTTCNPDQAITQARRMVHQEKVHFIVGPLCGHEGPAVAQVSKETGVPVVMDTAGADNVTKWDRTPTVIRTAVSASRTCGAEASASETESRRIEATVASNRAGMWSVTARSGRSRWNGCREATWSQRVRMAARPETRAAATSVRSAPSATPATRASTSAAGWSFDMVLPGATRVALRRG